MIFKISSSQLLQQPLQQEYRTGLLLQQAQQNTDAQTRVSAPHSVKLMDHSGLMTELQRAAIDNACICYHNIIVRFAL